MTDWINFDISKLDEADLVRLIRHHNACYWTKGALEISDERYDELIRALEKVNPDHSLVTAINSPQVAGEGKIRHDEPMLSLDKAYSFPEVEAWAEKYKRSEDELFLIQPKYDGISANYSNHILATRGDGEVGENISSKLPLIELETAGYTGPVDRPVRGEILIRNDDFQKIYSHITKKNGGTYKNSRNAVGGIMGLLDIGDMLRQHAKLTLADYEMISYSVNYRDLKSRWPELVEKIEHLPYPMDGIVVKLADEAYSKSLGNTAHHPRGQIAFKFSGIRKESRLKKVQWSFGKNCLTPVAEIEPVEIGGVTIRHASLHNAQNIIEKDIPLGDRVVVERAGGVIPYIVSSLPRDNRTSALIDACPNCGRTLVRRGPELCCPNAACSATRLKLLTAAVKNIGIEHLGEPNIRKMMSCLGVTTLKDIFDLTLPDILQLEGFKAKSAANLLNEIAAARQVADYQVIAALNIPNVGLNIAKKIMAEYTLDELRKMTAEQMEGIATIGPERARALQAQLAEQAAFIDELTAALRIRQSKGQGTETLPTICFTGKMPEKRSCYEALAAENGYTAVAAVTGDLGLLVAQDTGETGGKLTKARKLGVKIISLDDWLREIDAAATSPLPDNDLFAPRKAEPKEQGQLF
ncbi:MAG: helix-hairpin-helix domain-containing protein [Victivallaceae bacterium]|nr:helix-hairpin-helix domain-containing protein [Victivallaceae bacterium]